MNFTPADLPNWLYSTVSLPITIEVLFHSSKTYTLWWIAHLLIAIALTSWARSVESRVSAEIRLECVCIFLPWNDPTVCTDIVLYGFTPSHLIIVINFFFFPVKPIKQLPLSLLLSLSFPLWCAEANRWWILALLGSFSAVRLGLLSIEIDSLGCGLALLRNVRMFYRASHTAGQQQPAAAATLISCILFISCSHMTQKRLHIKRALWNQTPQCVCSLDVLTNAQLVSLTQYVHHPHGMSWG